MIRSQPDWAALAARASTLTERLASGYVPLESGAADALLGRWCETVAQGDQARLARRLAWDSWDLVALRRCLGPGRLSAGTLPSWVETFREISEASGESWRNPGEPIPFEDLLTGHLGTARRRLKGVPGTDLLTLEAWHDLDISLARRLSSCVAEAWGESYDRFRGGPPDGLAVRLAETGIRRSTAQYEAFVAAQRGDGLLGLAHEWPVLARLTSTMVDGWGESTGEMLARFREEDWGPILRIEAGLSDVHDNGRSVHLLALADGRTIVYKPKSLGLEAAFGKLLAWCRDRGLPLELQAPRTHDRGAYGWAELVVSAPCPDREAACRFYRRAGLLLGLLHAFGSRDAHFENLVAHGEFPVLVDLEAWLPLSLHRWLPASAPGEGWEQASLLLEHSVLSTGMLPRWQTGRRAGEVFDVGGLSGGRPGTRLQPVWTAVNTDAMVRVWRPVEPGVRANVPILEGDPLDPSEFIEEIAVGFTAMVRFVLGHRQELLAPGSPLDSLAGLRTRLIFRPTAAYSRLRERSLRPACCRDGAVRSIEIDALARIYLEAEERPPAWPLLAAERQALEQGDIPLFLTPIEEPVFTLPPGDRLPGILVSSSLETLRARLGSLDESDLALQIGFIRAALARKPEAVSSPPGEGCEPLSRDLLLANARAIANRLHEQAIEGRDGSVAWIGPQYFGASERFEFAPLGLDLYGGTAGIALFLAALDLVEGGRAHRDLALKALAPVRRYLAAPAGKELGIGGLRGLGSLVYAFVAVARWLDEPDLLRDACEAAELITTERIARDDQLDVVLGSAGAILALLALDRAAHGSAFRGRAPLDVAGECGGHLVAHWEPRRSGFAHGAAGISYALLRLYARTGAPELLAAARKGLELERGLFLPDRGNWRELISPSSSVQTTWCHGAPGIALGRLGTLDVLDDPEIREEIRFGLATTGALALTPLDHLCCGNLGRAEILLFAAQRLGGPELLDAARKMTAGVLQATGQGRLLTGLPGSGDLFAPSLFKGAAGVGYTLLRFAEPSALPCLLLLEPPGDG